MVGKRIRSRNFLITSFLMLLSCYIVEGYDYNKTINESTVFYDIYNHTIFSNNDNQTFLIDFYDESWAPTTDFYLKPNNSWFFNTTNISKVLEVYINVSISLFNETYYMIVSNDKDNITEKLSFYFEVERVETQESKWLDLDVGFYEFATCSYNLPLHFFKEVSVAGSNGSVVNVYATSSWFNMTINTFNISQANYSTYTIIGKIAGDVGLGAYQEFVFFNNSNSINNVSFMFIITDCGLLLNYDDYLKECDVYPKGTDEYQYCLVEANSRYYQDWLYAYAQRNRTEIINHTQNVTVEVPIEVMRMNDTLKEVIHNLTTIVNNLTNTNVNLLEKVVKDDIEKGEMQSRLNSMESDLVNMPVKINKTAEYLFNKAWERATKTKKMFLIIGIILVVGGILVFGYVQYDKAYFY